MPAPEPRPSGQGRDAGFYLITSPGRPSCIPVRRSVAATLARPSRATGSPLWSQARPTCIKPVALVEEQWSDPHQQALAGRSWLPARTLAHRRVAAQVCAGIERHRTRLARSQGASSGASQTSSLNLTRSTREFHQAFVAALNAERTASSVGQATHPSLGRAGPLAMTPRLVRTNQSPAPFPHRRFARRALPQGIESSGRYLLRTVVTVNHRDAVPYILDAIVWEQGPWVVGSGCFHSGGGSVPPTLP